MKISGRSSNQGKEMLSSRQPHLEDSSKGKKSPNVYDSAQKEKHSMNDTTTNTKSTIVIQNKKYHNSSLHNNSETTLSSQFLRDSANKDSDSKGILGTPIKGGMQEEKKVSSTKSQLLPKLIKLKVADWNNILVSKEKEIHNLEEAKDSINDKINEAIGFIKQNEYIPEMLDEKDSQIQLLQNQLSNVMKELATLRLYKKSRSIGHIFNPVELKERGSINNSNAPLQRLKSLSPRPKDSEKLQEKYKMYAENPLKKLASPHLSSKESKSFYKPPEINLSASIRNDKSRNMDFDRSQLQEQLSLQGIRPQSPNMQQIAIEKTSPRMNRIIQQKISSHNAPIQSPKRQQQKIDLAQGFDTLLSKFSNLVDKYQKETKKLTKRNMELEKKLRSLMDSKSLS